jgi:hypothetical protein
MIGFIDTTLTIFLTINDSLHSLLHYTMSVFSSTVTEFVLIYESLTSGLRTNYECQMTTHLRITESEWRMNQLRVLRL